MTRKTQRPIRRSFVYFLKGKNISLHSSPYRATNDEKNTPANSTVGLSFIFTRKKYFLALQPIQIIMEIEVLRLLVALIGQCLSFFLQTPVGLFIAAISTLIHCDTTHLSTWGFISRRGGPCIKRRHKTLSGTSSLLIKQFTAGFWTERCKRGRKKWKKKHTADGAELVLTTIIVQTDGPDYKITAYFPDHCSIMLHQTSTLECFLFRRRSFFLFFCRAKWNTPSYGHKVNDGVIKRFPDWRIYPAERMPPPSNHFCTLAILNRILPAF